MINVTVSVPEDRVPEFYSMFGRWLAEAPDAIAGQEIEQKEWGSEDVELAKAVWKKFSPTAKALFKTLMSRPDDQFDGDELATMLNLDKGKHGIAGVLAWPSRHCFAAGRKWCWTWGYPDGETAVYWMTKEQAELFRQVADNK
ncbi:DUF6416 domain-containing protein [Couchioplanes caeruleus]|uniref:DUF6416 domain-containing protein n=1 Tax=Couchioplanes caeruleus TaxID=56438 RepID=UPI0020BDD5E1|nr:DUF6416 domain-containing protein [Couchioplanes caeruleus]UQU62534.1 DUF6416 domain-containing protein [Couchioplanes caeruleus]